MDIRIVKEFSVTSFMRGKTLVMSDSLKSIGVEEYKSTMSGQPVQSAQEVGNGW
jgi:hypothetical protein